jgi:glycosyltransferase involved in cell wall biosynthesis
VRADVPELLAASDVFVLASGWEGHPLSVMEAMAAGLPVVATAVGGVPELVADRVTGILVPPGDVRALATALATLAADPQRRRELAEAGRAAAAHFDVNAMVAVSLLPPSAFAAELTDSGVPVFSLGMRPGAPSPAGLARLASILRKLRPQILHCHMVHANLLGRVASLLCPLRVVISTAHSIVESSRRSQDARGRDWLYRLTDPLANATVAVCQAGAARYAETRAAPRRKLRVIPNGVDTSRLRPDEEAREKTRHQLGIGREFVWLAAGRLMWKKDYPTMLRAFAAQRGGLLLIAGEGPDELQLHALAGELHADVRFLGLRADVPKLMNACNGFLLSSTVEGLPVSLLEAASSALPCVTTRAGGADEIVLDGRTGYVVPPGDPEALAAAMSRLRALPPPSRRQMGQAAREHAVAHFDMDVVAAQWERLYEELLGE